jgi:putative ABC transport system permease protein
VVGRRFRIGPNDSWVEVVGVVGHVLTDGLDVDPRPQVYWPSSQRAQDRMVLVVKGRSDPASMARPVIDALRAVDPDQPVYDVRTMEEVTERSLGQRWLNAVLVGSFAVIALALPAIGLSAAAFGAATQIESLVYGVRSRDITTFLIYGGVLLLVSIVAAAIPARRAARVDPATTLRVE